MPSVDDLPLVYRLPLRSEKEGVDTREQFEHCRRNDLVGIGWGREDLPAPKALTEVLEGVRTAPWDGWGSRGAATIKRFADAANGSLFWTRHPVGGAWHLGQFRGPWRPDYSAEAARVDCFQVRDVTWVPESLSGTEVPGAVIRAFSGRGSSFSRIHDSTAQRLTYALFCEKMGIPAELPALTAEEALDDLDPFEVEDLVYTYLQVKRRYVMFPYRKNTAGYEYEAVDPATGDVIQISIKTGDTPVDRNALANAAGKGGRALAYSARDLYENDGDGIVEDIDGEELIEFIKTAGVLLPPGVRLRLGRRTHQRASTS